MTKLSREGFEELGRARKATKLMAAITRNNISVDLLRQLGDSGWSSLAQAARCRLPSQQTRDLVLTTLDEVSVSCETDMPRTEVHRGG